AVLPALGPGEAVAVVEVAEGGGAGQLVGRVEHHRVEALVRPGQAAEVVVVVRLGVGVEVVRHQGRGPVLDPEAPTAVGGVEDPLYEVVELRHVGDQVAVRRPGVDRGDGHASPSSRLTASSTSAPVTRYLPTGALNGSTSSGSISR